MVPETKWALSKSSWLLLLVLPSLNDQIRADHTRIEGKRYWTEIEKVTEEFWTHSGVEANESQCSHRLLKI